MGEDCPRADDLGCRERPHRDVAQHIGAEPSALPGTVDREPAEKHDRHWVRHVAPDPAARHAVRHRAGREAVVADDPATCADDERSRRALELVASRATLQPVIERRNP